MNFKAMQVRVASSETIRSWSRGEVLKAETINYRTQKPEPGGLFCEKIFGPAHDYECSCGKYKGIRYRGVVCERCKVEVTLSKVRRERMGHVELASKIAHVWYYKVPPSKIGNLLDLSINDLERILFYESYVVVEGNKEYKKGMIISEEDREKLEKQGVLSENTKPALPAGREGKGIKLGMGGEALYELLKGLDLEELSVELKARIRLEAASGGVEKSKKLLTQLNIVEGLKESHIKPEWMILETIPVLPPDLRPLVPLEGGRYASSDLNDLYRRVITRNNRLKNLRAIKAPDIIIKNECRMLQESIDALFDNSRRKTPVKGKGDRPLKSLADGLKGKQGRFRRKLLGKRVDYSGRSVIIVDPELKIYECGLPKTMALELFKPFIIRELEKEGYAQTVKGARRLLEEGAKEIWEILERVVRKHPVILNRAPTLHRLSVQAFFPQLVEGKALRISPLVCVPFNADFDGDQMAVHIPLSAEAQIESLVLLLSANNIMSPANGAITSMPTQDVIIGVYWLTKERVETNKSLIQGTGVASEIPDTRDRCSVRNPKSLIQGTVTASEEEKKEEKPACSVGRKLFVDDNELRMAIDSKVVHIQTPIKYLYNKQIIETTPGRVIFNQIIPEELGFINETVGKKDLSKIINSIYTKAGAETAVAFLDKCKEIGYEYATVSGLTVGIDDMITPTHKPAIIEHAIKEVERVQQEHKKGTITESERYNTVVDIWTRATTQIEKESLRALEKDRDGFNPLFMMAKSGARGNIDQVRQITGSRGLMTRPTMGGKTGEIIETPINSAFKEGLTVLEYFISTHGARKGLTDTALKTAQAGYLTRKLVDVAQDMFISEEDCGTIMGLAIGAIKEGEEIIEPISERIVGHFALEDVINPITSKIIVFAGEEINEEKAGEIEECGITKVMVRSVLTCESGYGLCRKCYGRDLSKGKLVEIGEAAGIIAAQSIGEPGTQLTLRTFHIGGTATRITKESEIKAPFRGQVKYDNLRACVRKNGDKVIIQKDGKIKLISSEQTSKTAASKEMKYKVPYGSSLLVEDGQVIEKDTPLFRWDPYSFSILSEVEGEVRYYDLKENESYRLEYDERTGRKHPVVVMHRKKRPELEILKDKIKTAGYLMPAKSHIFVTEGMKVSSGDLLAKIPREVSKTRDITGGLPRVVELFEARHPKNKAIVTEIDGVVELKTPERGYRIVAVHNPGGEIKKYRIPYSKHLLVYNNEEVIAGDKITDGPVDPHDILKIKGLQTTQEFLVNQIQEVYRLQGVKIADKHIGIIVRQMLSKVQIKTSGDTPFIEGTMIDKRKLKEENDKISAVGGTAATFEPILVGVTKAILTTESYISAASFQETTKVLTEAAVHGKIDYLRGIKENVILGGLIPVGTGCRILKKPAPAVTTAKKEEHADNKSVDKETKENSETEI